MIDSGAQKRRNGSMKPRWIAIAVIVGAVIGIANILVLFVLVPHWAKAGANPPPATAASPALPATAVAATGVSQRGNTVATTNPGQVTKAPPPVRPPVQAGWHMDRQVFTPSGNLRIEYLRDRQQGVRQIALQDAKNPSNATVLTQYKRNAWVVVSPNDEWIAVNSRTGDAGGAQLYHRVSAMPLKYEVPDDFRSAGGALQDVVWQSYLSDTEQEPNTDRQRVTIDAVAWEPDSQKVSLSVAPKPTKDDNAAPIPWTCTYNVVTRQIEPVGEVAEGPANEPENASPNESTEVASENAPAPETTDSPAEMGETAEMDGEKFPATRQEPITVVDVNELPLSDIRYAINEMFARQGVTFRDADLKKTFTQFTWYQPRPGVGFEDVEAEFSDVEKGNIAVLRRCRDAKVASARRTRPRPLKGQPVEDNSEAQRFFRGVLEGVADKLNGDQ